MILTRSVIIEPSNSTTLNCSTFITNFHWVNWWRHLVKFTVRFLEKKSLRHTWGTFQQRFVLWSLCRINLWLIRYSIHTGIILHILQWERYYILNQLTLIPFYWILCSERGKSTLKKGQPLGSCIREVEKPKRWIKDRTQCPKTVLNSFSRMFWSKFYRFRCYFPEVRLNLVWTNLKGHL